MDPAAVFGDQSSDVNTNQQTTTDEGANGGTPPEIDPEKLQAALGHFQGENQTLKAELEALKASGGKSSEIIEKMKGIFSPEDADPSKAEEEQDRIFLDQVLEAALEAEKDGRGGMPITVQLAGQNMQLKGQVRDLINKVDQLTNGMKQQQDPMVQLESRALTSMDSMTRSMIGNIYGQDNPHMFQAVTAKMTETAREMIEKSPDRWAALLRNPEYQKRFSQWHVEQFVPPKAREMLHHQKVMSEEMPISELHEAYKQADIEFKDDPDTRRKVKTEIRHKILEATYAKARR